MRSGLYDTNGIVVNVIEVGENYTPPAGLTLIQDAEAAIGDTVENGLLIKAPTPPAPEPEPYEPTNQEIVVEYVISGMTEEQKTSIINLLKQKGA